METTDSGEPKALVLGDGDLSFSAALNAEGLRLTATTLESREDLVRRYANAGAHIAALEGAGARVLHGVDATRLRETLPGDVGSLFHRIIFNFPYQAFGGIKGLRRLLAAFLEEAAALLAPDGVIEVALCAGQGGTAKDRQARGWANSWRAPLVAARQGLALAGVDDWHPPAREGFRYAPLREPGNKDAAGGAGGKGFPTDGALVHRFVRCRRAVCGSSGEVGEYSERLVVAQAAMLAVSPFPEASWHEEDDEDRGTRYGPRHPRFRPGQRARLCCPHGLSPGALCTAAREVRKRDPWPLGSPRRWRSRP
ncbi:unnamed protein product [Effrenium voratum]|nr:unnamed protein product [Effrenium voratum]